MVQTLSGMLEALDTLPQPQDVMSPQPHGKVGSSQSILAEAAQLRPSSGVKSTGPPPPGGDLTLPTCDVDFGAPKLFPEGATDAKMATRATVAVPLDNASNKPSQLHQGGAAEAEAEVPQALSLEDAEAAETMAMMASSGGSFASCRRPASVAGALKAPVPEPKAAEEAPIAPGIIWNDGGTRAAALGYLGQPPSLGGSGAHGPSPLPQSGSFTSSAGALWLQNPPLMMTSLGGSLGPTLPPATQSSGMAPGGGTIFINGQPWEVRERYSSCPTNGRV